MREYFMGLLALTVCICMVELLSPAGEGGGIARHVKLLSALCLLCVMITPLMRWMREGGKLPELLDSWLAEWMEEGEQAEQDFSERWEQQSEQLDLAYAGEAIACMLEERFSLAAQDVRVEVIVDADKTSIVEVRVALSGQAIWVNTHEMEAFIAETFGCESSIFIE